MDIRRGRSVPCSPFSHSPTGRPTLPQGRLRADVAMPISDGRPAPSRQPTADRLARARPAPSDTEPLPATRGQGTPTDAPRRGETSPRPAPWQTKHYPYRGERNPTNSNTDWTYDRVTRAFGKKFRSTKLDWQNCIPIFSKLTIFATVARSKTNSGALNGAPAHARRVSAGFRSRRRGSGHLATVGASPAPGG
jgi:hypothetical protein